MSTTGKGFPRTDTDASLRAERQNTSRELATRSAVTEGDADEALRLARERADRLLDAARAATDASLPLSEQTRAAVALLLRQRDEEDRAVVAEREHEDARLTRDRSEHRERLAALLVLERQTTDLHLALERRSADHAISTREDFLAIASHDLGGMMAAHKLCLALLVKESGDDQQGRRLAPHLATLATIHAQMERMVGDLIDFAAIEAGRLTVKLKPYSAAALLSTAASVFEPVARARGQSFSVAAPPADVDVRVDFVRGVQVLGNLLSNAIKFTSATGNIRVGFEVADEVVFFVADDGPGVPPELSERIFERFVGSESSVGGLGLGLFISSQLVGAHEGRLWLDRGATAGAVFRFTLPRASA